MTSAATSRPRPQDRFVDALREIINVLGPEILDCEENKCAGCRAEAGEALRIAKEALGVQS